MILAILTDAVPTVQIKGRAASGRPIAQGVEAAHQSSAACNGLLLRQSRWARTNETAVGTRRLALPALPFQQWVSLGGLDGGRALHKRFANGGLECALARASRLTAPRRRCTYLRNGWEASRFQSQEIGGAIGFSRSRQVIGLASRLLSLGAHFLYGTLFRRAYAFAPTVTEHVDETLHRLLSSHSGHSRHYLVGVHARHRGLDCLAAGETCIAPFARAVQQLVLTANRTHRGPCAVLYASDRRRSAELMKPVARRLGCAFVRSTRSTARGKFLHGHDNGEDTDVVTLRDVYLLSHADDLVGSYGSTLSLTAQELLAARWLAPTEAVSAAGTASSWHQPRLRIPTVTYCSTLATTCLRSIPLIANPAIGLSSWWHMSLERWPRAFIRVHHGIDVSGSGASIC